MAFIIGSEILEAVSGLIGTVRSVFPGAQIISCEFDEDPITDKGSFRSVSGLVNLNWRGEDFVERFTYNLNNGLTGLTDHRLNQEKVR